MRSGGARATAFSAGMKNGCAVGSRRRAVGVAGCIALLVSAACAPAGEVVETPLTTVRVASGLSAPVYVTHAPGDAERLFIVEQRGLIKVLRNGVVLPTAFLDVHEQATSGGEAGLLGLAFHPAYQDNGYFYINYTDTSATDTRVFRTVIVRYTVSANPEVADPDSAHIVLMIDQPYQNHNAGWMDFGSDGNLYIATGDGGSQWDPEGRGQDTTDNLLGKILRIDVDGDDFPGVSERNYAVPADNPFVGVEGDDEIWAYGLRNPWRNSFDVETGELYIADVGQYKTEEVNVQPAGSAGGENYGWNCMEGTTCTGEDSCECGDPSLAAPVHQYAHGGDPLPKCSISGGFVYRGCAIPDLRGAYFFADYCSGQIWSFRYENGVIADLRERTEELEPAGIPSIRTVSSFGRDIDGELYICDHTGGEVFKIVPASAPVFTASGSSPPDGAIDARQPSNPDGTLPADGWRSVDFRFTPGAPCADPADFAVTGWVGSGEAPAVEAVERVDGTTIRVHLDRALSPVSRLTLSHVPNGGSATIGWLPGDVNNDGTSAPPDILALIDVLNGVGGAAAEWCADIDRSGVASPPDILRVIDLLNGAGVYPSYNGVSLP